MNQSFVVAPINSISSIDGKETMLRLDAKLGVPTVVKRSGECFRIAPGVRSNKGLCLRTITICRGRPYRLGVRGMRRDDIGTVTRCDLSGRFISMFGAQTTQGAFWPR